MHESDDDKLRTFTAHNLITEPAVDRDIPVGQRRRTPSGDIMVRLDHALKKTRNNSAPGPDGISWKLLKAIKDTRLWKVVVEDVEQVAESEEWTGMPEEWRDMKMVMIPKPDKDHTAVKGWRPIVLANSVGKLVEKAIAQELQKHEELWHERAFAGRKGRGAIDSVMLMAMIAEKHPEGSDSGAGRTIGFQYGTQRTREKGAGGV